jgi:hypothetical protein
MPRHILLILVLLPLALAAGCAHRPGPVQVVRVAVLDGQVLEDAPRGDVEHEGWWFGAHDRYRSEAIGRITADALAAEMKELPGVDMYSREDIIVYLAQKERLLKRAYPNLTPDERKQLLTEQNPVDYGRSLNVDYVVRPVVLRSSLVTNRVFSVWYSQLEMLVEVYNTTTGTKVQEYRFTDFDYFDSQLAMAEECARQASSRARKRNWFGTAGEQ